MTGREFTTNTVDLTIHQESLVEQQRVNIEASGSKKTNKTTLASIPSTQDEVNTSVIRLSVDSATSTEIHTKNNILYTAKDSIPIAVLSMLIRSC